MSSRWYELVTQSLLGRHSRNAFEFALWLKNHSVFFVLLIHNLNNNLNIKREKNRKSITVAIRKRLKDPFSMPKLDYSFYVCRWWAFTGLNILYLNPFWIPLLTIVMSARSVIIQRCWIDHDGWIIIYCSDSASEVLLRFSMVYSVHRRKRSYHIFSKHPSVLSPVKLISL